ncbi:HD domain-containing phosphohydrolase [Sulfurimonas sp.]|uniref:HD domain-containing phosphohydrolase n=1 Tax=Sulfurimonas sp. TaxID=2022749 RepID=UPI0025E3AC5A|nr:HD domain-containing phosphohydrolase [Sulfurimonas sp.]
MYPQLINAYNILCIDDDENNLFTLSALLENSGNINVIEALGAKAGLDKLLLKKIDLILLDVQMPEMNGFEVAKLVKSNKKTKHIPIIFVTAVFKSEEFIKEGFEIGAVDYLTKPIDDNQLLNKIMLYLEIFEKNHKIMQSEKKFIDIAQSIGDGIYTLDLNNNTTFVNNQALKKLGFEYKELIAKEIHEYIHYKDINNIPIKSSDCKIHKAMNDGEIYKDDNEYFIKKDGSFLPVSILSTPLYIDNKIIGSVTVFRDNTEKEKIVTLEEEKIKNQEQIIYSMIDMIESRDSYTAGHTKRVAHYCELIALEMQYSIEDINLLKKAAWLHDIGKISTPDSVLLKPNKLNKVEYKLIQEHLSSGYEMLSKIDDYKVIANIMREHHEKYNGKGYPRALKANAIMPLSRIMIVADAFDAMTTNRVYKPKKSLSVALQELEDFSAEYYHPEVVEASLKALANIDLSADTSQLPKTSMEEHRFSYFYKDRLTNLFIIDYLPLVLRYHLNSDSVYLYSIELHNFSEFNKKFGWSSGDRFLIYFANFIDSLYDDTVVFRIEGDDFMILSDVKRVSLKDDIIKSMILKDTDLGLGISEKYIQNIIDKDEKNLIKRV